MSAKSAPPCSTLTISSCRSCWGWGKDTYYQVYCGGASSITAVGPVAENVQPEFPSPILVLHVIRPFPACLGAHDGTNTAAVGRRMSANAPPFICPPQLYRLNRARLLSIQPHDSATVVTVRVCHVHSSRTPTTRAVRIAVDCGCGNWCVCSLTMWHVPPL